MEPKMMCICAYQLPLKKSVRVGFLDGIETCMDMPEDEKMKMKARQYLYDTMIYKLETIAKEFCSVSPMDPCKEMLGMEEGNEEEDSTVPESDPVLPDLSGLDGVLNSIKQMLEFMKN